MPNGLSNVEVTGDFGKGSFCGAVRQSLTEVGLEETGGRFPVFCPQKDKCYGSCPSTVNNGKTKDMKLLITHWTTGSTGLSSLTDGQQRM